MEKYVFFIIIVFFFSCEKDQLSESTPLEFCWTCTVNTKYKTTGVIPSSETATFTKCGWTEKEMDYYIAIKSEPIKIVINASGGTATVTSEYNCVKQ